FCAVPNLVLSAELIEDGARWEDPLPAFRPCAARVGHVHSEPDPSDSRTRGIPLLKRAARQQRYALALEAFSLARGAPITESSSDLNLQVGPPMIPTPDARFGRMRGISPEERPMRVRFLPRYAPYADLIRRVPLRRLLDHHELANQFAGKV